MWRDVTLAMGSNTVLARGGTTTGGGTTEDRVTWTVSDDVARNVRIDAGAIVAGHATRRFGSDAYFTGGKAGTLIKPAEYGKPAVAAVIAGTNDAGVVATYREGRFGYAIPLADGRYTVTLTFVEPTLAAGARVFDVSANGKTIVKALDIARDAGGPAKALTRSASVIVRGGKLDLAFAPGKGDAIVSAIEIAR